MGGPREWQVKQGIELYVDSLVECAKVPDRLPVKPGKINLHCSGVSVWIHSEFEISRCGKWTELSERGGTYYCLTSVAGAMRHDFQNLWSGFSIAMVR